MTELAFWVKIASKWSSVPDSTWFILYHVLKCFKYIIGLSSNLNTYQVIDNIVYMCVYAHLEKKTFLYFYNTIHYPALNVLTTDNIAITEDIAMH